jgi:antitoxin ParD1/3/4
MAVNTSILLGEHFEKFIDAEISSRRYNSASEVVIAALRLLENNEEIKKNLVEALKKGERSKKVENFDSKKHLAELHQKHLLKH